MDKETAYKIIYLTDLFGFYAFLVVATILVSAILIMAFVSDFWYTLTVLVMLGLVFYLIYFYALLEKVTALP